MKKINIVIPMAGKGQRFIDAGYTTPKPLLQLGDKEIIAHIIDSMRMPNAQFIFVVRKDHCEEYNIDKRLLEMEPSAKIVLVDEVTQGAVCTVLLAKEHFNDNNPVIIKDCDEITNWDPDHFFEFVDRHKADGAIVTIHTQKPSFSFAKVDQRGIITETAEKNPISTNGSVGIYYFARGKDLIKYAERMIEKNIRVNNEFYTAPVYNQFIQDLKVIMNYPVAEMFGMNTPDEFLDNRKKVLEYIEARERLKNKDKDTNC